MECMRVQIIIFLKSWIADGRHVENKELAVSHNYAECDSGALAPRLFFLVKFKKLLDFHACITLSKLEIIEQYLAT